MGKLQHSPDGRVPAALSGPRTAERRRSQRYAAGWAAYYRLDPGDEWRECRVIDVSSDGAALELQGATQINGIVGPIEVQIASVTGERVGVSLRGVIRRHAEVAPRRIVAGIEFTVLRPEERNALHLLVGLRSRP